MSGVFQKFQKYQMTLRENVMISNLDTEREDGTLLETLKKADVDMESQSYPDGLETMLSREFDGVDLSGGQWQRVSIARGINRDSKVIVLDEPTAAIDPIEETKIYKKFKEISDERTTVLVTHRLGSARIADRIVVMENGRVAEIGTHDELMNKQGTYYVLFMSQAQWYENQNA
jgi:ATP-binding cassette subfamily B protein